MKSIHESRTFVQYCNLNSAFDGLVIYIDIILQFVNLVFIFR